MLPPRSFRYPACQLVPASELCPFPNRGLEPHFRLHAATSAPGLLALVTAPASPVLPEPPLPPEGSL